nr:glutamine-hydrolyzing carbamoyl-phosphate synthase small subunit [Saprospiraceae bacterium]
MNEEINSPAILMLDDGTVFRGLAAGRKGTTTGELCFNTAMTGYQEAFTDPSYHGQILIMTNVHIGNYGAKTDESENDQATIKGMVCRNFQYLHSRSLADFELQQFLDDNGILTIYDIDTRALVRHIRTKGALNAIISSENFDIPSLKEQLKNTPSMKGLELSSKVCTKEPYDLKPSVETARRVAVMDYGIKKNILRSLLNLGCEIRVFPAKTSFDEIKNWNPDAYFLSNGPGDPASMDYAIPVVNEMLESGKPLFGICLGHQLLCMARGIKTFKMHHGHRGINHPVLNLKSGKAEVTSQNHGFGVDRELLDRDNEDFEITHINLNDQSVEGVKMKKYPAFSVQYHPEAAPGPHDSQYLFDEFIEMIDKNKN